MTNNKAAMFSLSFAGKFFHLRRPLILLASDMFVLFGVYLFIGLIRILLFPHEISVAFIMWPLLFIAPIFFYLEGLYNVVMPPFAQELRRLGIGISVSYLTMSLMLFLSRYESVPSRSSILLAWIFSLALVPWIRVIARRRFSGRPWWGRDVVLFGKPETVANLTRFLRFSKETGLRPAAALCFGENTANNSIILATLPVLKDMCEVHDFAQSHPGTYAIILSDAFTPGETREMMENVGRMFSSVFLMLDFMGDKMPLWLQPGEIARTMTLQMRQNLFDLRRVLLKRTIDIIASGIGCIILSPVFIALALWIKFDSSGPIFFAHKRLGKGGKHFKMLKFRTMTKNADQVLADYLENSPDLRKEWEENQKLRHDPRITRAGVFLRRYSLDELPQILNVFIGNMSLVGPRPIVDSEIERYGTAYDDYVRVRPGMTGLWQVSGRTDTTYNYRVSLDNYYICNWSIWMDIWILARTPLAVICGVGAY